MKGENEELERFNAQVLERNKELRRLLANGAEAEA